ncbi:MAG: Na(+)-translocating NADH-quinone reductase subunit F [Spirochaetes bacterium ADurb.BinA120]|nr:MAG: Na(+)-translocating NADH-quinone reductase subunit F [Spirochaetes bacterium ADurb.BinA120]
MIVIVSGVAAFTLIILALGLFIIAAEWRLAPQGAARILVNGDEEKAFEAEPGKSLLTTLSLHGVLLPSSCGGKGTCGTCKCQVMEGGGDILPIETAHISRAMEKRNWRLSCQVKVRSDMSIRVPDEIFSIKRWDCEVVSNANVATFIKEFIVRLPEGETLDFRPGGYIQIDIPPYEIEFSRDIPVESEFIDDWKRLDLFDFKSKNSSADTRAYSMANYPAEGNLIRLNVRIATPPWDFKRKRFSELPPGIGSSYIFSRKPGDRVAISGPFGEFFIQETDREMMYIGGGAGMAPLRSHIFHLFNTDRTKRKVNYWYGARSRREIFYEDEFRAIEKSNKNFSFNIALSEPLPDDNWKGHTGFIHQAVYENYLKNHPAPEEIEYYLCGPPMMLDAVLQMLDDLGVEPGMIRFDKFG